jgi:dephospho-CoA kinase
MRIIGITGGIGSGKTTVCGIFAELGVPIYYADDRAKAVMVEDAELMASIIEAFGKEAYTDGKLNRPFLAQQVFTSEERLAKLNSLVHPAVARDFMKWVAAHSQAPYIIKEAAILFESGAYKAVQETVLVTAPEQMRIQRVVQRDAVSESEVRQRMSNQWSEGRKEEMADHIIVNDGHQLLIPQVLELHRKFIR